MVRTFRIRGFAVLIAIALTLTQLGEPGRAAGGSAADSRTEWLAEKEIYVPMRDGVNLSTDVLLPTATGKLPTILIRTPYDKDRMENQVTLGWTEVYLKHGYAVVIQSERGRYFSEGNFSNYLQGARTDGYDTIEWIVRQPWSNGRVGTVGCSSSAEQQWPMAASNHSAHAAMITAASGTAVGKVPGNDTRGRFYRGGIPVLTWASWYGVQAPSERLLLPPESTQEQRVRLRNSYSLMPKRGLSWSFVPTFQHLPSKDILRAAGGALSAFDRYITWTPDDPRWNEVEHIGAEAKPKVPAIHLDTWHDLAIAETTHLFKHLQDLGIPDQYLIIGAGPHCAPMMELIADLASVTKAYAVGGGSNVSIADLRRLANLNLADLKFGELELGDTRYNRTDGGYMELFLAWFDYWLKGKQNRVTEMPNVQLYVSGRGWITGDHWPLRNTQFTKYYLDLHDGSHSNPGTGLLSTNQPKKTAIDSYRYDPGSPTPSGIDSFYLETAVDQRAVEARKDVLVYSTAPLAEPVTIVGPIEVVLYVSSSAKDTDFVVKLVDVYPDGKAVNLSDDALRARYREGFSERVMMRPGSVYKIRLPNMRVGTRFEKGHRIRLHIASSSFPFLERNLNTGGNNYDEARWVVAENSIHHGPQYPSHIILPILAD